MKPKLFNPFWFLLTTLVIVSLACRGGAPAVEPVTPDSPTNTTPESGELSSASRARLISATVQIFGLFNQNGELIPGYVGSGTILTPTGLILTNSHVASPAAYGMPEQEPDALAIALIVSEDKPAVPSYMAQVLAVDGYLDLAVIQITSTVNGTPVDPNSLNLPYVELGNSDNVHVGDSLNIFGFPSIGGNTITFTKGTVSGFSSENQIGDRAWIKTDATISGGNSGGLAADSAGRIIGVPTIAASGADIEDITDCRQIQDTNGDGVVNQNDSCIPIGGFLNGIRPVNLAMPLIQAAQSGRQYTSPFSQSGVASQPSSGNESVSEFVWLDTSNALPDKCSWADATVTSYPETSYCIASGFTYSGMTDGQMIVEYWYKDGQKVSEYSYVWEWGGQGLFGTFLPNDGNPMPAGSYRMELYAGESLTLLGSSPEIAVGSGSSGSPQQPPQPTGDTVTLYGIVYDASTNNPISGAYVFVLTPGTTYEQWANADYADSYINTYLQTGADGSYSITGIPRNTQFTVVYSAQGYYDAFADNLIVSANDPALNELNVGLNK